MHPRGKSLKSSPQRIQNMHKLENQNCYTCNYTLRIILKHTKTLLCTSADYIAQHILKNLLKESEIFCHRVSTLYSQANPHIQTVIIIARRLYRHVIYVLEKLLREFIQLKHNITHFNVVLYNFVYTPICTYDYIVAGWS